MATKEELLERAKELDVEGRSSMNKEELEKAVAEAEDKSDSSEDHLATEEEAKDASDERLEAVEEEAGPESAELAAHEMDESGPLHTEAPHDRVMTGAVSEEHAEEQEEALSGMPEDHLGDVSEAGFDDDGKPAGSDRKSLEEVGSKKENLSEEDDREVYEVYQEDVIDFPEVHSEAKDDEETLEQEPVEGAPFATSAVAGGSGRVFAQKGVFYTDGLSGPAEQNLERAYEIPELLQSSDPEEREAGDESLSEAAKEEKTDEEVELADDAKSREEEREEEGKD